MNLTSKEVGFFIICNTNDIYQEEVLSDGIEEGDSSKTYSQVKVSYAIINEVK